MWISRKPGQTILPEASITRSACGTSCVTATTRPSSKRRFRRAWTPAAGSMSIPFRIRVFIFVTSLCISFYLQSYHFPRRKSSRKKCCRQRGFVSFDPLGSALFRGFADCNAQYIVVKYQIMRRFGAPPCQSDPQGRARRTVCMAFFAYTRAQNALLVCQQKPYNTISGFAAAPNRLPVRRQPA